MESTSLWLIGAFVVISVIAFVIHRWMAPIGFGILGLIAILVPCTLEVASGSMGWDTITLVIAGVLVLAADVAGKIGPLRSKTKGADDESGP